jgi:hypothetical protein
MEFYTRMGVHMTLTIREPRDCFERPRVGFEKLSRSLGDVSGFEYSLGSWLKMGRQ